MDIYEPYFLKFFLQVLSKVYLREYATHIHVEVVQTSISGFDVTAMAVVGREYD